MRHPLLITALASTLALSVAAHAGSQVTGTDGSEPGTAQMQPEKGAAYGADAAAYEYGFENMDRDHDGYLSREEARRHEGLQDEDSWEKADADHDGKLSQSEFSALESNDSAAGPSDR